jgi:hypothetical protein
VTITITNHDHGTFQTARTANQKDFVDTRSLEDFDRSGFIDGLYKQKG